jgi:tetratricopeptide (TPR) repeat protein
VRGARPAAGRHLDAATLDSLGAGERSLLVHVASCAGCRRRLAGKGRDTPVAWTPDAASEAAFLRLLRDLESDTELDGRLAAIERERCDAEARVRELLERPDSWGTAATEPRYASLAVARQLLAAASGEEPPLALRLIELAGDITVGLAGSEPGALGHRQLLVEVRCARAHRLLDAVNRGGASRELRRAARQLAPDLVYGRALYCQALARLRRDARRWEEALALGGRAAALLERYGSALEAGQAQIEQGWTLIEAGDPEEALPWIEAALPLVEGALPWAVRGRLGLAVAMAAGGEGGETASAGQLLGAADRLIAQVPEPGTRLRLRWQGARAARRCGQSGSACRRLWRVVAGFLARHEDREAAGALLELLALCLEREWLRALGMTDIRLALGTLGQSPQLDRRSRAVIGLVGYVLHDPSRRRGAEVVANASRYLVDARYRPALPFRPTRSTKRIVYLEWDEMEPGMRGSVCVEVGLDAGIGHRPAQELDAGMRDLLSWRFEVLRQMRIEFRTARRGEPPA